MRKTALTLFAAAFLISCGQPTPPAPEPVAPPPTAKVPEWITALRNGGTSNHVAIAEVEKWLGENLPKGEATQQEVAAVLGRPEKQVNAWVKMSRNNLDRPKRDNEELWQYTLVENSGTGTYLVMQFDPEKHVLLDCTFSYWICGFCPHVFAFDGGWRLEGKMLPGAVGADRAGVDTLLLPRLQPVDGRLRVRLSNLAPETDHITQAQLAAILLGEGEELDIAHTGQPVVWRAQKELPVDFVQTATVLIQDGAGSDVVVLEVRNTHAFETAMRAKYLHGKNETSSTAFEVRFDEGEAIKVKPVGTKFLRRIVLPLPPGTRQITLRAANNFWQTRRLWLGKQRKLSAIHWQSSANPKTLRLEIHQHAELEFPGASEGRFGYALRLRGWYELEAADSK